VAAFVRIGWPLSIGIGGRLPSESVAALPRIPQANIPPRCNRNDPICFSPYLYRARNLVERFFNKIKHCRRVATRYDKLAANYLAFVQLASIRLWLRVNESTS
jgi:transposase